ncbi:uncharacterized protein BO72DRAFT_453215 [Aspergillus fijiensis CBS 313.89]|uniref:Uncharacterized protein n=1 Tax=Aspergillus fijiensis CBS 313.89 TaxID=1448319 RepID=A0A8G1RER4_9EURO|nr:uncharacterized protein BO72DRAFT_453215 [Aspergillus fijiensis CBS 313.89]RAK71930.1 hypothetical protein BO72DRAFT_453215 [Aspergillus fijiensis CBS 313.89]
MPLGKTRRKDPPLPVSVWLRTTHTLHNFLYTYVVVSVFSVSPTHLVTLFSPPPRLSNCWLHVEFGPHRLGPIPSSKTRRQSMWVFIHLLSPPAFSILLDFSLHT